MSLDGPGIRKLPTALVVSDVEFLFQVLSLEGQLTRRHIHFGVFWPRSKLGSIKAEPASVGFIGDMVEITVDGRGRNWSGSKPFKLRVVSVSASLAHQDFAREKPFPPKGDQAF